MRRIFAAISGALALTLLSALAVSVSGSPAQAWPDRPVKFLLPIGPGSGVDITARLFADRLSKKWGQPVVVENRPGGDGMMAINAFIGANDDHTLLFAPTGSFTAHPYLHEKLPYDPREMFPVARISSTVVGIAVPASLNTNTLSELIAMIKAQPDKLNWATATGLNDFLMAGYMKESGLVMSKVPYRDTVAAINDLGEGRIQLYIGAYAIMRSAAQSGKVKIIAVTNRERATSAPEIPTAKEAGFPALGFDGLTGLFGPRTLSAEARDKIAADVKEMAADPEIIARLTATGQNILPGTGAEFAAAIDEQRAQIAAVGKTLGIKAAQ
jgi:tripartite-type tricarboxylate transporter receptor subunit TctC